MIIILLGPPGVGKGTQAKLLSKKYNLSQLSTGEILRKAIDNKSEIGLRVQEIINQGGLVSDDIVCDLVEKELLSNKSSNKAYILDGFPRTIKQAENLNGVCVKNKIDMPYIISLKLEEKEIFKRLSARVFCSNCNQSYNLITNPTSVKGVCDKCGSKKFYTREDDKEDAIKKRLEEYNNQTKPLMDFYKTNPKYIEVNANNNIEDVSKLINKFLDK
ncbi:adenylate kinase [Candidatus Aquarickettsia rohweri]|uniref:Adenylate kinase n=1 Tax=Candidatus Aquarickettsia rohweri TaxID=2602574 RepID=A0A3R9XWX6_9RICK|nr:adenylate kinase [Candidatus Aquarickettsia rohweri]RST68189.1 adenylate kinase [Candidatus Aquarickettsia rohweri]